MSSSCNRPARLSVPAAFLLWLLAISFLAGGAPALSAPAEPLDAPPKLISTGGPKWKNLKELKQFAEKGDPQARFELAGRYFEGDGVEKDLAQALTLYEQAAQGGVADASFRLGKIYHDGLGVPQDYAKSFAHYVEAGKHGVPEAQHNIGAMLVSARGVKRDYVEGLAWLIVAHKSGADSTAEAQVREQLAKRPADIAAAEARASELWEKIQRGETDFAAKVTIRETADKPVPLPSYRPERVAPAKIDIQMPPLQPPAVPAKP